MTFYRGSKFGNVPLRCQGNFMHHSKLEAKRCNELSVLQTGGLISELEAHPQPSFDLEVNGIHVCRYIADFRYLENGDRIVEDVKGMRTEVYKFKAKLLKALYGIEIREVRR